MGSAVLVHYGTREIVTCANCQLDYNLSRPNAQCFAMPIELPLQLIMYNLMDMSGQ